MSENTDSCGRGHPDWALSCRRGPHTDGDHEAYSETWTDDVDPDELGTFGEYLDAYTSRGGMTKDERTAFWMSWTRHSIVWGFVGGGALVVTESFGGLVGNAGLLTAIYAALVLIWQVVDAVRFVIEGRRWRS